MHTVAQSTNAIRFNEIIPIPYLPFFCRGIIAPTTCKQKDNRFDVL